MSTPFDQLILPGQSIQSVETTQGSGTYYIKRGTYTLDSTITFDQNNCRIEFAPGVVINANTGGLVLSGDNIEVIGGPVTIDNSASASALALTVSGADCHLSLRNGSTIGNVSIAATGDRTFIDGGGWGTVIESIYNSGDDCIIQYCTLDSKTSTTGLNAIEVQSGSGRAQILFNKILDSDGAGIQVSDPDCLVLGNLVMDADGIGIFLNSPRNRVIANNLQSAVSGDDIDASAAADNSIISGNYCAGKIDNSGDDVVIAFNRAGSIEDDSGTSTVQYNELGTASCAITGTATVDNPLESEIVTGGETLILTLTNASWINPITKATIRGLFTGDHSEANDWDNEVGTILADAGIVRTSDTVLTLTFQAAASYSITSTNEVVSIANIPVSQLTSESTAITPDVTSFTITEGS